MSRVNNLFTMVLISGFLVSHAYAANNTPTVSSPPNQGMANYNTLATPPDITQSSDQWLIYFGPTKDQADKSKSAASKRKYVEKRSPLKAVPSRRVERPVNWITLTPDKQITLDRSSGTDSSSRSQTSIYGY